MGNSRRNAAATLAVALLFAPYGAHAESATERRIQALEQRLLALEDKLEASERTIEEQRVLLTTRATPAAETSGEADPFLRGLVLGGHVTGSYVYNFNNPRAASSSPPESATIVPTQTHTQFHRNHNTFSLDAAKIEIGRPTSGPGTAGFQIDVLLGENRRLLTGERSLSDDDGELGVYLQEAYVSYDWRGIELLFGKWETMHGAELIDTPANVNVSQGLLFFGGIPLVHTGLLARGKLTEELGWALGLTNGFNNFRDSNDNKGAHAQLHYTSGDLFASASLYVGADGGDVGATSSTDEQWILDLVASYQLTDRLKLWMNADWGEQKDHAALGGDDSSWVGVALGTRFDLTDRTYAGLRTEWFGDRDGTRFGAVAGEEVDLYSLTGTIGHRFADNLIGRLELRYDRASASRSADRLFADEGGQTKKSALLGLAEVSYLFD